MPLYDRIGAIVLISVGVWGWIQRPAAIRAPAPVAKVEPVVVQAACQPAEVVMAEREGDVQAKITLYRAELELPNDPDQLVLCDVREEGDIPADAEETLGELMPAAAQTSRGCVPVEAEVVEERLVVDCGAAYEDAEKSWSRRGRIVVARVKPAAEQSSWIEL